MTRFDNSSQGNQGRGLSLSDLPFNIFNGKSVDQTSWSWLNLIGQKPSQSSAGIEGVSKLAPKYNYLYNGHWHVDQVNEGALYTVNTSVTCMDGFKGVTIGAGVFKVRRVADPDNAALMCAEITCTTADASIGATDRYIVYWSLEGSNVATLMSGTSLAKTITIKFKFKSNVTGIYTIQLQNSAGNRNYGTTINVLSTAETEYLVTMPLDITGTWLYANATIGLYFVIVLASGSNYTGSTETWSAGNTVTSASQCNFMSSTSNICYIKAIQLVEGTVAGDIMPQSYDEALRECQRYYEKSYSPGTIQGTNTTLGRMMLPPYTPSNDFSVYFCPFKRTKSNIPTIALFAVDGTADRVTIIDTSAKTSVTTTGNEVALTGFNGWIATGTTGSPSIYRTAFHWTADCRL